MTHRTILTAALGLALALPASASASDASLVNLSLAHIRATEGINICESNLDCYAAITRSLRATTRLTQGANARLYERPTPACLAAGRAYLRFGRREIAAAQRFLALGGGTRLTNAYYDAAARLDRTLPALVKACG